MTMDDWLGVALNVTIWALILTWIHHYNTKQRP